MTFRDHAVVLRTLDPAEPSLDDLEPLRTVVAGARVVGLGEGAHFVREFSLARARLLRYLIEECRLTTLALEMGAGEATALNPWLSGEGDDADLPQLAGPLTIGLFGQLLNWLRRYNRDRPYPLRIAGIDLPNTLTLCPDLYPVAQYLRVVDPEAAELLDRVLPVAGEINGGSAASSAPQWGAIAPARRDALTAVLARLSTRMRALEPEYLSHGDPDRHANACRHLETACHTELMLRAMNELFSGDGMPGDTSVRDHFMATTVQRLLAAGGQHARIAVVAHNNHIQKTPVRYDGKLTALPMGHYLTRALDSDYVVVALTHTGVQVPEMVFPAGGSPVGFAVEEVDLAAPAPGSVERALLDAGFGGKVTLTELRATDSSLSSIRTQSAVMETNLARAFDAVLASPAATRDETLPF